MCNFQESSEIMTSPGHKTAHFQIMTVQNKSHMHIKRLNHINFPLPLPAHALSLSKMIQLKSLIRIEP
jgi:hypothetical protein